MEANPTPALDRGLEEILARHPPIAAAWLFGSVARGDDRPDSDLDLGVIFQQRGQTALDHHRMLRRLAAELETVSGGRQVDLVVLESQGPILCHRVLSEGRLVYEADPDRRVDFESTTYVRYFDFLPTWQIAASGAIAGIQRWLATRR